MHKVEIVDSKDPLVQFKASKSNIEDLFKNLHKLLLFILILLLKQRLILKMIWTNLLNKSCTRLIIGLMKDLVG